MYAKYAYLHQKKMRKNIHYIKHLFFIFMERIYTSLNHFSYIGQKPIKMHELTSPDNNTM